jgi:hypothetical protein
MLKVKLNTVFECEGKLYSIAIPTSPSIECNLRDGRLFVEFDVINNEDDFKNNENE